MFFQTNPLQPIIVSSADSIIPVAFSPSGVATAFVQILQLLWQGQEFPCTPQDVICGTGGQAPQDGVEQSALGLVRFIRCERSSKIYWNRVTRKKTDREMSMQHRTTFFTDDEWDQIKTHYEVRRAILKNCSETKPSDIKTFCKSFFYVVAGAPPCWRNNRENRQKKYLRLSIPRICQSLRYHLDRWPPLQVNAQRPVLRSIHSNPTSGIGHSKRSSPRPRHLFEHFGLG